MVIIFPKKNWGSLVRQKLQNLKNNARYARKSVLWELAKDSKMCHNPSLEPASYWQFRAQNSMRISNLHAQGEDSLIQMTGLLVVHFKFTLLKWTNLGYWAWLYVFGPLKIPVFSCRYLDFLSYRFRQPKQNDSGFFIDIYSQAT